MKVNKSLALILAILMAVSMLSACGGDNNTSADNNSSSEASAPSASSVNSTDNNAEDDGLPAVGDFSKKLKLTWYMCSDSTAYKESNDVAKTLNEKFNVEITTLPINGFDNDKMNVTLASGDIPDVFIRWGGQDYYKDGIIQAITKEMIAKYMPETNKVLESYGDAAYMYATSASGNEIIGVPQITVNGDMVATMAIRQDWLDKVGAKVPATIDELTEVLRKFTLNDPDGNSKNDTYGISAPGLHNNLLYASFPTIFGAFGTIPTYWTLDENGQVSYSIVQTGYKNALKQIRSWYKEGFLDPEWVTIDNATFGTKVNSGVVGVWDCVNPTYLNSNSPTSQLSLTKANNPNAEWTYMAPITGPDGKSGGASDGPAGSWTMMFGAKASIDQVARGMQIAEAINNDRELFEMTFYGFEGTTFTRNSDGSNTMISGVKPAEYGANSFRTASMFSWDFVNLAFPKTVVDLMKQSTSYPYYRNVINKNLIAGTYDEMKVDAAEMDKLTKEFFFNAITGEIDIDAEWDNYVQKWMDLGGKLQTEGARTLPILYTKK